MSIVIPVLLVLILTTLSAIPHIIPKHIKLGYIPHKPIQPKTSSQFNAPKVIFN
jgi:hypothetical protein